MVAVAADIARKRKEKGLFNATLDNIQTSPGSRKKNYAKSTLTLGEREKK